MLTFDELHALVQQHCSHGEAVTDVTATPKAVKIAAADLLNVCRALHAHPTAYFDSLSCLTGIDNGVEAGTMEVVYNLYSIPFGHHLMIKITVPRAQPEVDSVCDVWKAANWHERELYDMFGIMVKGHPDLRRILMPADWEGYPLRKDYKQQEYYRNIKLDY
jgi:NADH-quinone oxidoreductase subunit C